MTGLRVLVAEDDVLLREGLASLLERSGYAVVGQAGDGTRLLALAREAGPDLVAADIRMPPTSQKGSGWTPDGPTPPSSAAVGVSVVSADMGLA
jgi:CheY-like chemotaxis protein